MDFLRSLWSGIDFLGLKCCECGYQISPDDGVAQTVAVESQKPDHERAWARRIHVATLKERLLVYHRHLECLLRSASYVAISHVWHPDVAELQYKQVESAIPVDELANLVREVPARVYAGLCDSSSERLEIWHDYVSVPQWQPSLKSRIIRSIPSIYGHARYTIVHLADTDAKNIQTMRNATQVRDRCRALSIVCNAMWFRRAWTVMEMMHSSKLMAMCQKYVLVENAEGFSSFVLEMRAAWTAEIEKQEFVQTIERMCGMGYNLVPWQLGPLEGCRARILRGESIPFAIAHEVLARRQVTIPRDFFHALLGILRRDLEESQLHPDSEKALLQIVRHCIRNGDLSALLMLPSSADVALKKLPAQRLGFMDLTTFAMGHQEAPPTYASVKFSNVRNPIVSVENIGAVHRIIPINQTQHSMDLFCDYLKITLEYTGPDINEIVHTLGARIYGQEAKKILTRLNEGSRMFHFSSMIRKLVQCPPRSQDDDVRWVADAMGLSNKTLKSSMTELAPLSYTAAHGGTIHLSNDARLAEVVCYTCQRRFLLILALLVPEKRIIGCSAFRIPGLKYFYTQAGGAGFVLKDGHRIARFAWAVPTCDCPKLGKIEVTLADVPLPQPNTYDYGHEDASGWLPIAPEDVSTSGEWVHPI